MQLFLLVNMPGYWGLLRISQTNGIPKSLTKILCLRLVSWEQRIMTTTQSGSLKSYFCLARRTSGSLIQPFILTHFSCKAPLTLCEATARGTKLRKMQFYRSVFYQKNEALLLITTLPCLKVFVSLMTKNKSKSSWHTEKFAKCCLKEKSSGRMRTKRQNRKVCSSLRCISSSPGH